MVSEDVGIVGWVRLDDDGDAVVVAIDKPVKGHGCSAVTSNQSSRISGAARPSWSIMPCT